ncbi:uncharacterized protein BDR25DRAFT_345731 [Lindgomyces ingoldianus]|uniref:Uncharacterized protein n=1 Tax=Lindgomyces ingoldianus TaxID=673940 RepID=A0ACB6QJ50_9PLEO|nr:uncharacterized protein BDR25DRAFT_345731 [Lindgomyces ingoldianus]KAF2466147.1 hypothetical protein BDR25DRAFT_345731 [Lindgomyces ingoldianus]
MSASRRNGKPASCEPCRKNKTRCDHAFPKCDRCRQRGISEKCFYHPAPLTKPRGTPGADSSADSPKQKRRQLNAEARNSQFPLTGNGAILTSRSQDECFVDSVAAQTYCPGYLGPTSYAAILPKEDESSHSGARQASIDSDDSNHELAYQHPLTKTMRVQLANNVLRSLRNYRLIQDLILLYCENNQAGVVAAPLYANAVNALNNTVENYNLTDSSPDPRLVSIVLENTSQPLNIGPSTQASEFHGMITGDNLRLEIIGLLLASAARSMMFGLGPDSWSDNSRRELRPQLLDEMLRSSTTCLVLCTLISPANDVMIWMFYENLLLTCVHCGYTSPQSWRRLGELSTQIYALGIHKESNCSNLPLFILETRRRLFCAAYSMDKTISTFLGRPPRLSNRHTDIKPPLDLSDMDLTADLTTASAAIKALDPGGWNQHHLYLRTSWIRLRFYMSQYREEILDFALSKPDAGVQQQLLDISIRCRQSWDRLPPHLRYYPTCWDDSLPYGVCLMLVIVYLTYLYNEFLVHKLLDRTPLTSNTPLLLVSMDLLSTALTLATVRDRTYEILLYGIPSGSVLVTALQEQHQTGQAFPTSISRSEIIRTLSVLISHLESVAKPGDGNYSLCRKAMKAFTRVIDAVLDPKPAAEVPATNANTGEEIEGDFDFEMDLSLFQAPGLEGYDGMDLVGGGMYDGADWGAIGQRAF